MASPTQYLHGVETNEVASKTFAVQTVPTAIICLTGIAPSGATNVLTLCQSTSDVAQFGAQVPGFSIPQALNDVFAQGNATVCVVNVFNPGTQTKVIAESITLVSGAGTLAHIATLTPINGALPPVVTNSAGTHTYTVGTDYTINPLTGALARVGTNIGATDTIKVTYYYFTLAMTSAVSAESVTVNLRAAKTAFAPVLNSQTPVVTDSGVTVFYVAGTDYTIDDFGNLLILSAAIADGTVLKVTYQKLDATTITASTIVGGVDSGTGIKTGMFLFKDVQATFGFKPKLLLCPIYNQLASVVTQLIADALTYRSHYWIDAPLGTTIAGAIAGRQPSGSINFYTNDKRCILTYPELTSAFDGLTRPYSQFDAGITANNDSVNGYWTSPSNKTISGITGTELTIDCSYSDPNASNQLLNGAAIKTVFNVGGTGALNIKASGNRNASFNQFSNTGITTFICVTRTADIIEDSIEAATAANIDIALNQAGIDFFKDGVNAYLRSLIAQGTIIDGSCTYDPTKNPPQNLAQGKLVLDYEFVSPPPAERITYNSSININLLTKLS